MPLQGALSIYPGEKVLAYYRASAAPASFRAMVRVEHTRGWEDYDLAEYDTGTLTTFTTTRVETATDSQVPSSGGTGGCIVVGGGMQIRPSATALKRGAFYARFVVQRGGPLFEECLCCGYLYDAKPFLSVGEHVEPGPGGGEGAYIIEALKVDTAPAATTTLSAVANTIRRILGYAWYYNCAAVVASRVLSVTLAGHLGAVPTGFAGVPYNWQSASTTLTTGEEGSQMMLATGDSPAFLSFNDNTTLTYANHTTAPSPFPYLMTAANTADLDFNVTAGDAGDRDSIYVLYEEWLVP